MREPETPPDTRSAARAAKGHWEVTATMYGCTGTHGGTGDSIPYAVPFVNPTFDEGKRRETAPQPFLL